VYQKSPMHMKKDPSKRLIHVVAYLRLAKEVQIVVVEEFREGLFRELRALVDVVGKNLCRRVSVLGFRF